MTNSELQELSRDPVIQWLLGRDQPVVRHHALLNLLDLDSSDPVLKESAEELAVRGWASDIMTLQGKDGFWDSTTDEKGSKSLYTPKYTATNWRAIVLSDFGLTKKDKRVQKSAELFFSEWLDVDKENIFGEEVCIVGNTARLLTRFGYSQDQRVQRLFERLLEIQKQDGGWHCFESDKGTLDCWEALAAFAALPQSQRSRRMQSSIERGAEFYLERKLIEEDGTPYAPWYRFHYPNHYYYDLLVGLDVLTDLGYAGDARLRPALEVMKSKSQAGKWLMEKIHPDLDEGANYGPFREQPRPFVIEEEGQQSKWLTLKAMTVQKRVADKRNG